MGVWNFFSPEFDTWYQWNLNGAQVFLCRGRDNWFYGAKPKMRHDLDQLFSGPLRLKAPPACLPSVVVSEGSELALRPIMLNRPIVIEAINALHVLRDQELTLRIDLPVSVYFKLKSGETLCRLNTFELAKTWFGDTSSGILSFSWPQNIEPINKSLAVSAKYGSMLPCRIIIRNLAKSTLEITHLAVYTELLHIWERDGMLRTDTVLLEGLMDGNLKMSIVPDPESRAGTLLCPAALGHTELLVKRGVSFLRNMAGIN